MAELTPCIDCGHRVSRSALECPKCNSPEPHGVDCLVCQDVGGSRLSIKQVHEHPHRRHSSDRPYYYHPDCVRRVLAIATDVFCPECSTTLSQCWKWEELCENGVESCKNCGVRNVFGRKGSCAKCRLPILVFHRTETARQAFSLVEYHESCFQALGILSVQAEQRASIESKRRVDRITRWAACIGAITGFFLGTVISTVISMFSVHGVVGPAICAAGFIGTFVGGFIGAGIGDSIARR